MNIVTNSGAMELDRTCVASAEDSSSRDGYKYALRVCIAPGHYEDKRIAALIDFCARAAIDEVVVFSNCEEINTGHIDLDEMQAWLGVARRIQSAVAGYGIGFSLNPWSTILHTDRGRRLKPGQDFRLMVDIEGQEASACACPLCEEWQEHIRAVYAEWASLDPKVLWIEDDFRFHNHSPLNWGGCFCEEHLRVASAAYGRRVSREELIESITAPGRPHALRAIWLDLNGRTLVKLAARLSNAVKRVSPETRLGLMTSVPATHCAEGRDWSGIVDALGGADQCIIRPHLPAYWENTPGKYLWLFTVSRQTAALLSVNAVIYPELDNGPHTRFAKSRAMTAFQIAMAACLGNKGITLNIFDMIGNGTSLLDGHHLTLSELKPFLNYVSGLGLSDAYLNGIVVPFSSRSSYTLDTSEGNLCGKPYYDVNEVSGSKMELLYPDEGRWASLLSCFGFSTKVVAYRDRYRDQFVAVSGQWLRNLSNDEITSLFESNIVILDGSSAAVLCDLGLGHLAGIRGMRRSPVNNGIVSYEEISDSTIIRGISNARFSAQVDCGDALLLDYDDKAQVVSQLKDYNGNTTAPGTVIYDQRCVVLPFFFPDSPEVHILNSWRQELFQVLLSRLAPRRSTVSFSINSPYLAMYRYDLPDSIVVLLANASADIAETPTIFLGGMDDAQVECEICEFSGNVSVHRLRFSAGYCRLPMSIPAMRMIALTIPPHNQR